MNKSDTVYNQKHAIAQIFGFKCFEVDESVAISEYDKNIEEINFMIRYYISVENKEEVSQWRKMLQQVKVEKRRAKKMIDNKSRMENAYT